MLHYYLQKGFKPEEILRLSDLEKSFYFASMEIELKDKADYFGLLGGVIK